MRYFFAVCFVLFSHACASEDYTREADLIYEEAMELSNQVFFGELKGDEREQSAAKLNVLYEQSINKYREILDNEKLDEKIIAHAYGRIGLIYDRRGDADEAIVYFGKSLNIVPDDLHIRKRRALLLFASNDLSGAKSDYQFVVSKKADDDASLDLGVIYFMEGRYGLAIKYISNYLSINTNNHFALKMRASAYYEIKEYELAEIDILNAIDLVSAENKMLFGDVRENTEYFTLKEYQDLKERIELKINGSDSN